MPSEHGTKSRYVHGCRCQECKAANTAYQRESTEARRSKPVPEGVTHGKACATNYGCKCAVCSEAVRAYNVELGKRVRAGKVQHRGEGRSSGCPCESCRKFHREYQGKWSRRQNSQSQVTATRAGYMWTGAEMEIASRSDLTVKQLAEMLGRSIASVNAMRARIARAEPKVIEMLGASNG